MSFRQFGGLQYAARSNIVGSNYNSINNLQVTQNLGQLNSYINFSSDVSFNNVTTNTLSCLDNVIFDGSLEVMGNVGIGRASSPSYALDVLNNINCGEMYRNGTSIPHIIIIFTFNGWNINWNFKRYNNIGDI
jgi:hypothetical protein